MTPRRSRSGRRRVTGRRRRARDASGRTRLVPFGELREGGDSGSSPNFRIDTLENQFGITIKLAGELDSATCAALLERFEQALAALDGRELVIDLDEVSFIDSSGMRAIIVIERRLERGADRARDRAARPPRSPSCSRSPASPTASRSRRGRMTRRRPEPFLERVEIALARDADAPARARAELRQAIARAPVGPRQRHRDASDLRARHERRDPSRAGRSAASVGLRITAYSDRIRVEVTDDGSGFDPGSLRAARPREAGGHGLVVVDGLASRWGTTRRVVDGGEGFCVWFELDADCAGGRGQPARPPSRPAPREDQFSTPSRSQQYSSRHSLASSTHRASDSHGSTVSNA